MNDCQDVLADTSALFVMLISTQKSKEMAGLFTVIYFLYWLVTSYMLPWVF
jgi:hypothetical protein